MGLWGVRPMVAELLAACGPQLTCIETVYMPPRGQINFFQKTAATGDLLRVQRNYREKKINSF